MTLRKQIGKTMATFRDQYIENNHSSTSVESDKNSFKKEIFESIDSNIPKKTIKGKADTPWMTNEIK